MAVTTIFKKFLRPKCRDVFEPAREQFSGKGSYGNGSAMRVAAISLAYPDIQDVKKVCFFMPFWFPALISLSIGAPKGSLGNTFVSPVPLPVVMDQLPFVSCRIDPVKIW